MKFNKKGAMELSSSTIVVLIIAIVVLGLALTLIRGLFSNVGGKFGSIVSATQLDDRPTADNPITIPGTVNVKQKSIKKVKIGFYNKKADTLSTVVLKITDCISDDGTPINATVLPNIIAPAKDSLGPGEIVGYSAILSLKGAKTMISGKQYVCTLGVYAKGVEKNPIETKSFYIQVVS